MPERIGDLRVVEMKERISEGRISELRGQEDKVMENFEGKDEELVMDLGVDRVPV